ncbi:MAG: alpha/beta hydrolase [archaeon]
MPYLTVDKIRIYYVKKGKGKPLVFLHGAFMDISAYEEAIDLLSKKYCVYAMDFPFHGKSDGLKNYATLSSFAQILSKCINQLRLKNPSICAHSAGCIVAICYASKNKVQELILIEPSGLRYFRRKLDFFLRIIYTKFFAVCMSNASAKRKINLYKSGFFNFFKNITRKQFLYLLEREFEKDYISEMQKINCKVTVLWAKSDELLPFKYSNQFMKNLRHAHLLEIEGPHDWIILNPDKIKCILETYAAPKQKF